MDRSPAFGGLSASYAHRSVLTMVRDRGISCIYIGRVHDEIVQAALVRSEDEHGIDEPNEC